MNLRRIRALALAVVVGSVTWGLASPADAHGRLSILVRERDPSRPPPVVNGTCDYSGEYGDGFRSWLPYRPRITFDAAEILTVATTTNLYVCVGPLFPGGRASLIFDTDHDGGSIMDLGDIRISIGYDGTTRTERARRWCCFDPGFVSSWNGARADFTPFAWKAEFRISLASLAVLGVPATKGMAVDHYDVRSPGDDFLWPTAAAWNQPDTWGDILILPPLTGPGAIQVDVATVTQGLQRDATATYEMAAGKDVRVLARFYTLGTIPSVTSASCRVSRFGVPGFIQISPASWVPSPGINPLPAGFFDGSPSMRCLVPGFRLEPPGVYEFQIHLELGDGRILDIPLGAFDFLPAEDLRLLLWPFSNTSTGAYGPRSWGFDLTALIPGDMRQLQRMVPVVDHTASIPSDGARGTAGVRWFLYPYVARCTDDTSGGCASMRGRANDALYRLNAQWLRNELESASPRDRVDFAVTLESTTLPGGGYSCGSGKTASSYYDADPGRGNASVITQEVSHCLGQVRSDSPNSDPADPTHSRHLVLPAWPGLPVVNIPTASVISMPNTVMFPTVGPAAVSFMEGVEWNDLRRVITSMGRPEDIGPTTISVVHTVVSFFRSILGARAQQGLVENVSVVYSQRIDDLALAPTPDTPGGSLVLALMDAEGKDIATLNFDPDFHTTHGDVDATSAALTVPVPVGEQPARVEIREGFQVLYSQDFSADPPVVDGVVATELQDGTIDVAWQGSDPDGEPLKYNLFFRPSSKDVPFLLESGLTDTHFVWDPQLAPATSDATFIVEATDGYNTAAATSNAVTVQAKPPIARIDAPEATQEVVEGQPVMLLGSAFDLTEGPLTGDALTWESDGSPLGTGEQLEVMLPAGTHEIRLTATAASQLAAEDTLTVKVEPDGDGDGMSDKFEADHICLKANENDGSLDPDSDQLVSFGEQQHGTDPCLADTDDDGFVDGAEVRWGTDPLIADSDGDGVADAFDNCLLEASQGQADADIDGTGDPCDPEFTVGIDIAPGKFPNVIRAGGTATVAIMGTPAVDVTKINALSVCFGDAEDPSQRDCTEVHNKGHRKDVDGDGRVDLVLHYETSQTGIDQGDTLACLNGEFVGGMTFEGCASIRLKL